MGAASWFYLGLILVILEFFLPGLVVVFLGLAALTVSVIIFLGYELSLLESLGIWFLLSLFYLVALRHLAARFFLSDAKKAKILDEEEEHLGKVVDTITVVWPDAELGRIRYLGTTWRAKSVGKEIPAQKKAKIVGWQKDKLLFLVEPVEQEKE